MIFENILQATNKEDTDINNNCYNQGNVNDREREYNR